MFSTAKRPTVIPAAGLPEPIFHEIRRAADEEDILTVLAAASSFTEGDFCARMRSELARISGQIPVLADIAEYRRWCPTLSRYSFHTRTMTGSLLPPYGVSA